MRVVTGILVLPFLCLLVILITGILIWVVLKRSHKTVEQVVEVQARKEAERQADAAQENEAGGNNRWARSDTQAEAKRLPSAGPTVACPACGAEIPASESHCPYCGYER